MAEHKPLTEAEVAEIRSRFVRRVLLLDELDLLIADWERLRAGSSPYNDDLWRCAECGEALTDRSVAENNALRSLVGELVGALAELRSFTEINVNKLIKALEQLGFEVVNPDGVMFADMDVVKRCDVALIHAAEMGAE